MALGVSSGTVKALLVLLAAGASAHRLLQGEDVPLCAAGLLFLAVGSYFASPGSGETSDRHSPALLHWAVRLALAGGLVFAGLRLHEDGYLSYLEHEQVAGVFLLFFFGLGYAWHLVFASLRRGSADWPGTLDQVMAVLALLAGLGLSLSLVFEIEAPFGGSTGEMWVWLAAVQCFYFGTR